MRPAWGGRTGSAQAAGRRPPARAQAVRHRGPGPRLRRIARGDRPFVLALFGLVALLAAMLVGPLQDFTAAAERVDRLEADRRMLRARVDELEERRTRLRDPDEIELIAREQLGLVKPGEIPYVVARPDAQVDQLRPDNRSPAPPRPVTWQERIRAAFTALFRRG